MSTPARIASTAALIFACAAARADRTLYVAPDGNDRWTGAIRSPNPARTDGPLATLEAALKAMRGAEQGPGRIILRGGRYFLDRTVELGPEDSGVTIEAARKEQPVLVGGRKLTGWRTEGERFWSAPVPDGVGADGLRLLVVDGKMRPRARLPETGTFTHVTAFDVPWMSTTGGGWKRKPTDAELTTLRYRAGNLGPWLDTASAEVTVYHMWDESVVGLKAHDPDTQTLTFSSPSGHPPGAFGVKEFVVWNVREGMRRTGQWYFDRTARRIVYWPLPGEKIDRIDALIPTIETVLRVRGSKEKPVSGVTVRGLTVTLTNTPLRAGGFGAGSFEGAVFFNETRDCRIEDLTVQNVAGQGIRVGASDALVLSGCVTTDTGACGIIAHGNGCHLTDNLVHDVGRIYPSAIGLWVNGTGAEVSHNEIRDCPYSGVIGGGNDHRFEYNLIHRVMRELHDGGGIYFGFGKRATLRGNVIRDIVDTGGYGASAYYLDEQAEDCLVEGNLSINVARPSHNHMARNNTLRGNVFVTSGDCKLTFPRSSGYTLEGNVVYSAGAIGIDAAPDGISAIPRNVLFSAKGACTLTSLKDYAGQGSSAITPRDGTLFDDPLFTNLAKDDFRYRPGSPAAKLGFHPLSVSQAGRRRPRGGQ